MNLSNKILYSLIGITLILILLGIFIYSLLSNKEEAKIILKIEEEQETLKSLTTHENEFISEEEISKILKTLTTDQN